MPGPVVFRDDVVPWVANLAAPTPQPAARLRARIWRLSAIGEELIDDVDAGYVQDNHYGNFDPGPQWAPGAYVIRLVLDERILAEGQFEVASAPSATASMAAP